jgi:hypothetical protein
MTLERAIQFIGDGQRRWGRWDTEAGGRGLVDIEDLPG